MSGVTIPKKKKSIETALTKWSIERTTDQPGAIEARMNAATAAGFEFVSMTAIPLDRVLLIFRKDAP